MPAKKPTVPRIRRQPEAARDNILAAAEGLLIRQGPIALKLVEVAAAAGVANATVMHHFGSIDGLHTALMERMTGELVEAALAAAAEADMNPDGAIETTVQALFDTFEARGAARLAAWLELTGEWKRLNGVRDAVNQVAKQQGKRLGVSTDAAEDMILVGLVLAMGAGLFGRSLGQLMGKPRNLIRDLAAGVLRARALAMKGLA
ncbi:MAG: TetR family transcriptional regulator [Micropepsaceae bacterium]